MIVTEQMKERLQKSPIAPRYQEELLGVLPSVEKYVPLLKIKKDENASKNVWKIWSWWAFFFAFWPYFFRGMWRKGVSLLGIAVLLAVLLEVVEMVSGTVFSYSFHSALGVIPGCLVACNYKVDLFRKHVLNESFWW